MESKARGALIGFGTAVVLVTACVLGFGTAVDDEPDSPGSWSGVVFPTGERLTYAVSWMGIKCGRMDIASFVDETQSGDAVYRIVVFARTSSFFDGIYKVRSRLDSYFDPLLMTSIRYEQHSLEKKNVKDEIWEVDQEAREVIRTKDGEATRIPVEADRAYDPVAFIYRLRVLGTDVGDAASLGLMTSKGVLETDARVTKHKQIHSKLGEHDAAAVVPEPRDKMVFSKSGSMVVWIERTAPYRPVRLDFDVSFGKVVASLAGIEEIGDFDADAEWERWIDGKAKDE
jgi:hypothetical protein